MTLYKRKKMWWVCYQIDGKRYRQSTHTRDYAVARTWAAQIDTARKMPTFEEAVQVLKMFYKKPVEGMLQIDSTWNIYEDLANATGKAAVSNDTMTRRRNTLERFIAWLKKERPMVKTVENVTGPIAAGFATYLAKDLKLKSKTRINIIAELNTIWKMLEAASTGVCNPWGTLRPLDVDGERGKAFTLADERRVLEAARRVGKAWPEVCAVMRHTGLRYGDVARLKWSDVDGEVLRLAPSKTKRHKIAVAIPIIAELQKVFAAIEKTGDFVFPFHAEMYGNTSPAARRQLCFGEVLAAAGLANAGYTVHSWRHTAATRLAEAGADKETRKALLGHTEDETAERYDHDEHLAAKRAALEKAARIG